MNAPRAERPRDACHLRNELGRKNAPVGIDIVDGTAVDSERRQQTPVIIHPREIAANMLVLPKNRAPSVATFDGAVKIVPMIHPTHWNVRRLLLVKFTNGLSNSNSPQQ